MTDAHEEKETLSVEVNIPGHADRVTTSIFTHTRKQLIERDGGKCWICGAQDHAIEAHHYPIERSLAGMVDWRLVELDAKAGELGATQAQRDAAKAFDFAGIDADPYRFVDDMRVNGLLLCKAHHTGKDEGIHDIPHPLWIAQRYGKEGYKFSDVEIIHHQEGAQ